MIDDKLYWGFRHGLEYSDLSGGNRKTVTQDHDVNAIVVDAGSLYLIAERDS